MPKNIVFCADGTWDSPTEMDNGVPAPTNVSKFYDYLINDGVTQVTYYDDGVGTSSDELVRLFQGSTGAGLAGKIMDGYQYIMNVWQPGDAIYLFGFSRGAYTVRSLGDMIGECGLLQKISGESALAQRARILETYSAYRKKTIALLSSGPNPKIFNECSVQMIGVWDTVGALGIPLAIFHLLDQAFFNFHNTTLHQNVHFGYQALAIDEERDDFKPTLWDVRKGIEQVWFAGAHADVGGGYAEHGLSDLTLRWMMIKALAHGVRFASSILAGNEPAITGDPYGMQHFPWQKSPFSLLPVARRIIPEGSSIHTSVKFRMMKPELNYHPQNLPVHIKYV